MSSNNNKDEAPMLAAIPSSSTSSGLTVMCAAALLIADCVGTGILALPFDVRVVLGSGWGVFFLMLNLPINLYAGYILSETARHMEDDNTYNIANGDEELLQECTFDITEENELDTSKFKPFFIDSQIPLHNSSEQSAVNIPPSIVCGDNVTKGQETYEIIHHEHEDIDRTDSEAHFLVTRDLIGVSGSLFGRQSKVRFFVLSIFYVNLFLVLGNYILVMSHSVQALIGKDRICIPSSGLIASTLMLAFSQIDSMAKLGRTATTTSLAAILIVIVQCLVATRNTTDTAENDSLHIASTFWKKMSALSSIGFAVGSQKLFLNIRFDMADKSKSAVSLSMALVTFVLAYIIVCLLAGPAPPQFLLDSIAEDTSRQIAGFFLWVHVAVSYAINSQALCSSIDHLLGTKLNMFHHYFPQRLRWFLLTLTTCASSYLVANAVPFFQDLTSLIGSLTGVPLSLLLPAIFYRKLCNVPMCFPTRNSWGSFLLLVFSVLFLCCGIFAAILSIKVDWKSQGATLSC